MSVLPKRPHNFQTWEFVTSFRKLKAQNSPCPRSQNNSMTVPQVELRSCLQHELSVSLVWCSILFFFFLRKMTVFYVWEVQLLNLKGSCWRDDSVGKSTLPHKHEDLSSDPSTYLKSRVVMHTLHREETGGSIGISEIQPSFRLNERSYLKKRQIVMEKATQCPLPHTIVIHHIQTHTNKQ